MSFEIPRQRFKEFLNVINLSYIQNKNKTPYQQLFPAFEKIFNHRELGIAIYKDDPEMPHDYYLIQFQDDHFEIVQHNKQKTDIAWKISDDYMQHVIDNSQAFIEHPEKLDWEWLKSRIASMN